MAITEAELILPSLFLLNEAEHRSMTTTQLSEALRELLKPTGEDLAILKNRRDDKFSQKVRNLVSHNTLQRLGYAAFENSLFTITEAGVAYLEEEDNAAMIKDKYLPDFEGVETMETDNSEEPQRDNNTDISAVYPQASLNIERTQFSVFELKRKKEKKKLILDPDFQRNDVWKPRQKAELVESILMNIPLPFIYVTENREAELIVVDGRQRLTALFEFMDNDYSLGQGLQILTNLRGKKFSELTPLMQGVIEDYQLATHIIKPPTSDRVLIDIFDRVNRGGTSLSNQEIRNALYQGECTKLLTRLSNSRSFIIATENSIKKERMKDKYLILRYLAFYLWRKEYIENQTKGLVDYTGDTEEFLAKYMQYINSLSDSRIGQIEAAFNRAMSNAHSILGSDAFRLPSRRTFKRPISMALFELIAYWMSHDGVLEHADEIKKQYSDLMNNQEFTASFLSIDATTRWRFDVIDNIILKSNYAR